MAGAVSYEFLAALARSVGMDTETVKQALAEINQLQRQTQALEVAVQGKALTNHASQQAIFGTADEQMYGHVKIAHEVTDDSTDGVAVSPDAVYAYAPAKGMAVELPHVNEPLLVPPAGLTHTGGFVTKTTDGTLCVTDTAWYTGTKPAGTDIDRIKWTNKTGVNIPIIFELNGILNAYGTHITPAGYINASGAPATELPYRVIIPAAIIPVKVKE